jgi:uncharacterized tellurite resistance protein B-like protein
MADDDQALVSFNDPELSALARLLTIMLRVDGQASEAENEALAMFAKRVRLGSSSAPAEQDGVALLRPYLDRAAALPVSEDDFVRAARVITNPQARKAVYDALYDISAADVVVQKEWSLLKVLVDAWDIVE